MQKKKRPLLFNGPEPIIRIVLIGTASVVVLMTVVLLASFAFLRNYYVWPRLIVALGALAYVWLSAFFFRRRRYSVTAWMLLAFFTLLGAAVVALWSINSAVGMLILGFTIVLSGIMLGARSIGYVTVGMTALLVILQVAVEADVLHPDAHSLSLQSTYLDVVSYAVLFILFAVISWLAGRRNEQLLHKSRRAEAALRKEKALLGVRLEQKTREVREAQLEEMRQLYQFAELGQLGAVLLHDLANNLTALTLDIDDIGRKLQRNESITRAKESIAYLETMVNGVRRQIQERDKPVTFNAMLAVLETVAAVGPKARRKNVTIQYAPLTKRPFLIKGDPVRFAHIITILISNAIDAYDHEKSPAPSVMVTALVVNRQLQIRVTDYGQGIAHTDRDGLFKPFSSTKVDGMGIGLFMAREMTEQHFKGTLTIDPTLEETTFVLQVPRSSRRERA